MVGDTAAHCHTTDTCSLSKQNKNKSGKIVISDCWNGFVCSKNVWHVLRTDHAKKQAHVKGVYFIVDEDIARHYNEIGN